MRDLGAERKRQGKSPGRSVAVLGVMATLAILFGYVEVLIPFNFGIPGIKLGLSNLVVLYALYRLSYREALVISLVRVVLIGFLFGNMFSLAYAATGAILSLSVMAGLKKTGVFGILGISSAGGTAHNIGQILVAYLVTPSLPLLWYLPILMIAGLITGLIIGGLTAVLLGRTEAVFRKLG